MHGDISTEYGHIIIIVQFTHAHKNDTGIQKHQQEKLSLTFNFIIVHSANVKMQEKWTHIRSTKLDPLTTHVFMFCSSINGLCFGPFHISN